MRIKITAYRNGKRITYYRNITRKQIEAAKRNIKKARKKWMSMSSKARRKAMPSRNLRPAKRYPVSSWITKDVGRPKHHYIIARKTKYGWEKVKLISKKDLEKKIAKARKKWMKMSSKARKRAMPERKGKAGYKRKRIIKTHPKTGKRFVSYVWVKK